MDSIKLTRLDPYKDEALYRQAAKWDESYPAWYRECKKFFGLDDFERLYQHMFDDMSCAVGIFDAGKFVAMLDFKHHGGGILELQVYAKRTTDINTIAWACEQSKSILKAGVKGVFAFVATMNKPIIAVCEMTGMKRDGVRILHGSVHNKVIQWEKFWISEVAI